VSLRSRQKEYTFLSATPASRNLPVEHLQLCSQMTDEKWETEIGSLLKLTWT
jgi:hypothetical protein